MRDQEEKKMQERKILIGPQYLLITPCDRNGWQETKRQMKVLLNNLSQDKFNEFVQVKYLAKGYNKTRLLRKIKTEYFWNGVTKFMIESMIRDSHILSCKINVLVSQQNTLLKLTKYQIFLLMCHLFMGTFPTQIYRKNPNFAKLMTINNDEDQIFSGSQIELRLNKLKAVVRYFCLFYKRSQQNSQIKDEIIVFQRFGIKFNDSSILNDSIKFCKVYPNIGEFYANNNQINSISINNICSVGIRAEKPIPGSGIYQHQMDIEQKIFFSHPQMLILNLILHEGLEKQETLLIHGAQKYSQIDAVSQHTQFNFGQKYRDLSEMNKIHNFKMTTFIFIQRCHYTRKGNHQIIPDIKKVCCALKACQFLHSKRQRLIGGYFHTVRNKKYEMPWDMKFLVDWISASIAKWDSFNYYVENQIQAVNIKILAKELKDYTVNDIVSVIESYYEFKKKNRGKLSLLEYFKDFVL